MKQKLLLLLLTTFTIITANAKEFRYIYKNQEFYFKVLDEDAKTCELTYGDHNLTGVLEIPSIAKYYDNLEYTVVAIGKGSLEFGKFTSVVIPNSVKAIGDKAFWAANLTSVVIPNSVTMIGEEAFSACNLSSVVISNSITTISKGAFSSNEELSSVSIPNSVITIGEDAFRACYKLSSVQIPNSVKTIESSAFNGCSSLVSIEIPSSTTEIGFRAFNCDNLKSISVSKDNPKYASSNGVLYNREMDTLIRVPNATTSIDIPNSVTTIAEWAIEQCLNLTSVNIPETVQYIGEGAFFLCKSLTSIVIPNSVTTIEDEAFYECTSLESLTLSENLNNLGEYGLAFRYCPNIHTIIYLTYEPCEGSDYTFDQEVYDNAELIISADCEDKIRKVTPWCLFRNIKGTADLNNIVTNDTEIPTIIYTLGGVKIGNSTNGLLPGAYIVRRGSTAEKIIVTL